MSRSTKRNYRHDYYEVQVPFGNGITITDAGLNAISIAKRRVKVQSESCEWNPRLIYSDHNSATFRVGRKRLIQEKQTPEEVRMVDMDGLVLPFPTGDQACSE